MLPDRSRRSSSSAGSGAASASGAEDEAPMAPWRAESHAPSSRLLRAQTERVEGPKASPKAHLVREVEGDDPLRLPHGHFRFRFAPGTSREPPRF